MGGQRQPYACLFYFAKQAVELFTPPSDFRFTFIWYCLTHAVAANEHLSLDTMIQRTVSDRDRAEAERLQEFREMCLMTVKHFSHAVYTQTSLFLMLFCSLIKTNVLLGEVVPSQELNDSLEKDADFCHNAGVWLQEGRRTEGKRE